MSGKLLYSDFGWNFQEFDFKDSYQTQFIFAQLLGRLKGS